MSTKTILLSFITALTLSGVSAQAAADEVAHDRSESPSRLEGAWQVTITPYVCATGELLPAFAVDSYMTFGARGTLAETTSNNFPGCLPWIGHFRQLRAPKPSARSPN